MKRVLTVSVHPDDETLGCGGTLLRHKAEGNDINWLIITNISEDDGWNREFVKSRQDEIDSVAKLYGFTKVYKLDFPTATLDQVPTVRLIESISEAIKAVKPEILYIPFYGDIHTDHQLTFRALMSCTKNFRYPFIKKVLLCETLTETEFAPPLPHNIFMPNVFIDISKYFENKLQIMKVYKNEVMEPPLPRSLQNIEALASYRGSRIGVKYAEAFMLIYEHL